jgi:site-specific recombinase XerD
MAALAAPARIAAKHQSLLHFGLLAGHRLRRPYIFSDTEIEALTAAAATASPRDGLRPTMLATLLSLLASACLRIGEAIRLTMDDVRLDRNSGPAAGGRLALHAGRRGGRCAMRAPADADGLIGPHLQAFFAEHLLTHKRASPQTIACYRDTFRLLLRFMQSRTDTEPEALPLAALDADAVLAFLDHLERDRGCSVRSRNNRLAAIRSFFHVVSLRVPDRLGQVTQVMAI